MADTPSAEQRAHLYEHGSLECLIPRCSCCPALISVILEAEAVAEARGFAKGLEAAARAGLRHVHDGSLKCSCGAIGPFDAPRAPPEVAAAEPKP